VSGEEKRAFACFGGTASVHIGGGGDLEGPVAAVEAQLLDAHARLSRFLPESELSRLNRDPRETVPVSRLLLDVAAAAVLAGRLSGGLVDATLLANIEEAGYRESLAGLDEPAGDAMDSERRRVPAKPSVECGWNRIAVDRDASTVSRPPGLGIDGGGLVKGLMADLVAQRLADQAIFAIDCGGDIRIGGSARRRRKILVEDPAGGEPLHELAIVDGAVATSGIARRRWLDRDGHPAHHLLDPRTGAPAFTGVVQATAIAPSALRAEIYAKHALLGGPERVAERLPWGGVVVLDDGTVQVVAEEKDASQGALVAS